MFFGVQFDTDTLWLPEHFVGLGICLRTLRVDHDVLLQARCLSHNPRRLFVSHRCVGLEPRQQSQERRHDRQADVDRRGSPDDFGRIAAHHPVVQFGLVDLDVVAVVPVNVDSGN